MKNKNNLIIGVVIALVIGGALGFFGGMTYQKSQTSTFAGMMGQQSFQRGQNGQGGQRQVGGNTGFGGRNGGGAVRGEILSADEKSITVKLIDGSSKIILVTDKTIVNKAADANKSDLKTGETVAAFGTTNSDGSITAVNIQLNPIARMMPSISPAQK